ncbi:DUF3822 family protein [Hoylesella enoeca]|uniref:DUF3822 family protein n=1 Tax=Hoylesella enoeca TaxID=76123 RepID=UPI00288A1172|nr:DUF3822 family protein [Hoylesella enoeca]
MQETGNNRIVKQPRITLRITENALSFAVVDTSVDAQVVFEPYIIKSGISMAANLREAFKTSELLSYDTSRAQVLLDTPVLLIPLEEFDETTSAQLYHHTFHGFEGDVILHNVLANLNAVAVFSINKDLKLVIDDHFSDVRFIALMQPVWSYLHRRSFTGMRRKLFGYFHNGKLDICSFDKNRFRFSNSFSAPHSRDAVYFLLYVWKQLALDPKRDELHIAGDIPDREWLTEALRHYLQNAYVINPTADFNRAPVTQIKGMPLDIMTLFIKGR